MPDATPTDLLKIGEAAALLGVCTKTLRNWDRSERLIPQRNSVTGYRYYRRADLFEFLAANSPQRLAELQRAPLDTRSHV